MDYLLKYLFTSTKFWISGKIPFSKYRILSIFCNFAPYKIS